MGFLLTETTTGMAAIKTGITNVLGFMGDAFNAMTSNVYLAVFLGATMLGAGICIFRKLRRGT